MRRVILLGMKAEVSYAVFARQLPQDVVAADLPATIQWHQPACLHPKYSHAIRRFLWCREQGPFRDTSKASLAGVRCFQSFHTIKRLLEKVTPVMRNLIVVPGVPISRSLCD